MSQFAGWDFAPGVDETYEVTCVMPEEWRGGKVEWVGTETGEPIGAVKAKWHDVEIGGFATIREALEALLRDEVKRG
jgi:hypothetical protein